MPEPSAPFSASPPNLDARRREPPPTTRPSRRARDEGWAERLFDRDTTLWSADAARPGRRSPSASAGSTPRPISPTRSPPSRASATAIRDAGLHDRGRRRDGRQQPRPGRPPPDVRHARGLPRRCASSTRPTRRPWPRPSTTSTRSRRSFIVASQVRHDDRAARVPRRRLGPRRGGARRGPRTTRYEHAGELIAAITDPGRSVEAIPHHDDVPRGLPQPARHRRPLLRADLRRARAGIADRARPRRAARVGVGDARRLPRAGPGVEPGRVASASPSGRSRRPAATS